MKDIDEKETSVEKIFTQVGDNGTYQNLLYWLFLVPINIIIPFTVMVPILQYSTPDHWCHVPGKPENITIDAWKNMTIPRDGDGAFEKCKQFISPNHDFRNDSLNDTKCELGWEYDRTWYDETVSTQQDWVCEQNTYSARWMSAGVAGNVVGALFFNSISDHLGRKLTIILTSEIYALFGICRLFMTSEIGLIIMMFLSSTPFPANLQISYIWVLEQVSRDLRAQITSLACIMWTIGMCLVALLAWLTRDWVILGIVTSLPFIPFILIWWAFPESPRWLMSKGRTEQATKAFKKIAKINKSLVDIDDVMQSLSDDPDVETEEAVSFAQFFDFFKYPVLRYRTVLLVTTYTCNYLTYYIILYNTGNISGNEFVNFFLFSITELPSCFIGWFSCQYFGRRWTGVVFFFLTTIVSATTAFCSMGVESSIIITLSVLCKSLINVSFFVIYIQIAELYPTSHRGTGLGVASIFAFLVGISGPYIANQGSVWLPLPYLLLAFICAIGTVTSILLPETLGSKLPQNLDDAETHLTKQPFWSYFGKKPWKKASYTRSSHTEAILNSK